MKSTRKPAARPVVSKGYHAPRFHGRAIEVKREVLSTGYRQMDGYERSADS